MSSSRLATQPWARDIEAASKALAAREHALLSALRESQLRAQAADAAEAAQSAMAERLRVQQLAMEDHERSARALSEIVGQLRAEHAELVRQLEQARSALDASEEALRRAEASIGAHDEAMASAQAVARARMRQQRDELVGQLEQLTTQLLAEQAATEALRAERDAEIGAKDALLASREAQLSALQTTLAREQAGHEAAVAELQGRLAEQERTGAEALRLASAAGREALGAALAAREVEHERAQNQLRAKHEAAERAAVAKLVEQHNETRAADLEASEQHLKRALADAQASHQAAMLELEGRHQRALEALRVRLTHEHDSRAAAWQRLQAEARDIAADQQQRLRERADQHAERAEALQQEVLRLQPLLHGAQALNVALSVEASAKSTAREHLARELEFHRQRLERALRQRLRSAWLAKRRRAMRHTVACVPACAPPFSAPEPARPETGAVPDPMPTPPAPFHAPRPTAMNLLLPPVEAATTPSDADALLALPGPQFVEAVYQCILGREPDVDGRLFFRKRLLEGVSKLQIAGEFAASSEAQSRAQRLPGLQECLDRSAAENRGLASRVRRALGLTQALLALEQRQRVAHADLDERHEAAMRRMAWLETQMSEQSRAGAARDAQLSALVADVQAAGSSLAQLHAELDRRQESARAGSDRSRPRSSPLEAQAIRQRDRQWT